MKHTQREMRVHSEIVCCLFIYDSVFGRVGETVMPNYIQVKFHESNNQQLMRIALSIDP